MQRKPNNQKSAESGQASVPALDKKECQTGRKPSLTEREKHNLGMIFSQLTGQPNNLKGGLRSAELFIQARLFLCGFMVSRMWQPEFEDDFDALFKSGLEALGFEILT